MARITAKNGGPVSSKRRKSIASIRTFRAKYMYMDTQIKRFFFPIVKVLRFNRKKPLPDAEDIDYVNSYINHGVSGSVSVTGYRSVVKVKKLMT